MKLEYFGYNKELEQYLQKLEDFEIGRIIAEHKERYIVGTSQGELEAEITGNLRFTAKSREDFPAVGDWVAMVCYDSNMAIIHKILPRQSILTRQAVGPKAENQVIAANIDCALIVQAVDRDFNINRIERYLTLCNSANIESIIILNKIDLIDDDKLIEIKEKVRKRISDVPIVSISNETQTGYDELLIHIEKGKTFCMLGSSGVGKSTLLNNLSGKEMMKTNKISSSTKKGRHTTSHRELIVLKNGGILIDNPGMREVGIADSEDGLENTFEKIYELSKKCKFSDCSHINEIGCKVLEALENGEIDSASYNNYQKMGREKAHFESTLAERRQKDKDFGKMVKNFKKDLKRNKY